MKRNSGKQSKDARATAPARPRRDQADTGGHGFVTYVVDLEPLVGKQEPEALLCERTPVRVVVPDPPLRVRGRREHQPSRAQHPVHLRDERDRGSDVLEHVFEHRSVERGVNKRQRPLEVCTDHVAAPPVRDRNCVRRAVDAGVARKVITQPTSAAAHVQELGIDSKMARHVAPIARFFVPLKVPHRRGTVASRRQMRTVHVGLNLVFLVPGETGGTEVVARELIPELCAAAPNVRFTAFVNREAAARRDAPWGDMIPAVTIPVRARNRVEWVRGEQQLLPRIAGRMRVDLLHSLANTAPGWGRFRRVVTIHDLSYRLAPDAHLGLMGLGMRVLVPLAARRSHRIIVDAASTREDLDRLLGVSPSKVDVVSLGLGCRPRIAPTPEAELRAKLAAGDRQIALCVAAKRPHKNLARLIGALGLIASDHRPLLVLPGYPTPHEAQLRRRAQELGLTADVRFMGWVDPGELEGLFAASACFVFPSLMEGFGLPVLEAMARGLPVACSARGSLAEVAADSALLFDPESQPGIAAAIERLLLDGGEAERLRAAGRQRAARFTWAAAASGTLASYERALGPRP